MDQPLRVTQMLRASGLDEHAVAVREQIVVWVGSRCSDMTVAWRHEVLRTLVDLVNPIEVPVSRQKASPSVK